VTRACAALCVAALLLVPTAGATSATRAQVRALAARASGDPHALAALRGINRVDGERVDLRRALGGAEGSSLRARLRALAQGGSKVSSAGAAADARQILADRRFHGTSVPRPFHGVLHWLGKKLRVLGGPFQWLGRHLPGGGATVWVLLAAVILGVAAVLATKVARRRSAAAIDSARRMRRPHETDPAALEREADDAERRGELERALRLRFRAGLLRLSLADAIPPERSLTSGEVRRVLGIPEFDGLARSFDEVVYGRRPPSKADVEESRQAWRTVLGRVGGA
jgi:hypothetical protein